MPLLLVYFDSAEQLASTTDLLYRNALPLAGACMTFATTCLHSDHLLACALRFERESAPHGKLPVLYNYTCCVQLLCRFPEYAQSKLCNVLFTAELQRRLQGQGILATSVSPGFVNTTIFRCSCYSPHNLSIHCPSMTHPEACVCLVALIW